MNNITVAKEVADAYADCWMDDIQTAYKFRNLDFACSTLLSKHEAWDVLSKYVQSYNAFTPDLLDLLPEDSMVKIAREGSVCLYVRSNELNSFSEDELESLVFRDMGADECQYNDKTGEYRIWWD